MKTRSLLEKGGHVERGGGLEQQLVLGAQQASQAGPLRDGRALDRLGDVGEHEAGVDVPHEGPLAPALEQLRAGVGGVEQLAGLALAALRVQQNVGVGRLQVGLDAEARVLLQLGVELVEVDRWRVARFAADRAARDEQKDEHVRYRTHLVYFDVVHVFRKEEHF